jgi:hypothetical protein
MSEPFPIHITKWCLSQGIEEATAWEFPGNESWCVAASGRMKGLILQSGQWHRTRKEAVKAAEAVRQRVLRETRNRLEELESVVFGGDDERTANGNAEGDRGRDHPDDAESGLRPKEGREQVS